MAGRSGFPPFSAMRTDFFNSQTRTSSAFQVICKTKHELGFPMSGQVSRRLHSRWCHRTGKNRQRQDRRDRHRATRRHGTFPQQLFRSPTPALADTFFCGRSQSVFRTLGVLRQDTRASWEVTWRPQTETDGNTRFTWFLHFFPFRHLLLTPRRWKPQIPSLPFPFSSSLLPPSNQRVWNTCSLFAHVLLFWVQVGALAG